MYNFVTNTRVTPFVKGSKYFKLNLGKALTFNAGSDRRVNINEQEPFIKHYAEKYGVALQSEGSIGSINFYTNFYIDNDVICVYFKDQEFTFDFNPNFKADKGSIDSYLGSIIKQVEEFLGDDLNKKPAMNKEYPLDDKIGDPDMVLNNPGMASYDDILAYMRQKQNKNRI